MQSACHVKSANRGKIVYSSNITLSDSCREAISLNGTMLAKFFDDQRQFCEFIIIAISIM